MIWSYVFGGELTVNDIDKDTVEDGSEGTRGEDQVWIGCQLMTTVHLVWI